MHAQWSQTESDVKKPPQSSVSCLKTVREDSFISELSQGTPETKIALKWTLEGVRRTTKNKRVARESSQRPT